MPEVFTHIDFWIIVGIMVTTIWYQKRSAAESAHAVGFKTGAALGMLYGVKKTTEVLTSGKYSLTSDKGTPVYANEALFDEVLIIARDHLIKNPESLTTFI